MAEMEQAWEDMMSSMMSAGADEAAHRGGDGPDGASLDGLGVTDGGGMEGQRWLDGHDGHDWRGHADDDADDGDEGALPVHLLQRGLRPDGHAIHAHRCRPEVGMQKNKKDCKVGSLAASLASINICGELVVRHYCLAGNNSPLAFVFIFIFNLIRNFKYIC